MPDVLFPLKMVQDYNSFLTQDYKPFEKITNVWKFIDEIVKRQQSNNSWYEKCYIPDSMLIKSLEPLIPMQHRTSIEFQGTLVRRIRLACILAHWRRYKEVYRFDIDMLELLFEASDTWENEEIPTAIFKYMPFPCFYIEQRFIFIMDGEKVCAPGFFVFFNQEYTKNGVSENSDVLHFYFELENNRSVVLPFNIFNLETVAYRIETFLDKNPCCIKENLLQNATRAMQLVIYICSQNADIAENPVQSKLLRRKESIIIDKYREVRIWDVGERIGKNIRLNNENKGINFSNITSNATKERNRPRPHARKAHWRVYKEGINNREKTKIVFIHEQIINTNDPDRITAIVHELKK